MTMPAEYITLDYLTTIAGMVAAVTLLTQFFKGVIKRIFRDATVRLVAWIIAFTLQVFMLYVNGSLGGEVRDVVQALGTGFLNSVVVTLAATGTYETLSDPMAMKEKPPMVVKKLYQ
jgi:hypothetical protein